MNAEVHSFNPESVPHSVEAEQMVLGAILLGEPCDAVQAAGGESLFYDPLHAAIYRTCRMMEKSDKHIGPTTVKAHLPDDVTERLSDLGGNSYITRLAGYAISPRFIADYAEVLAEARDKRALIDVMRGAQSEIARGERSASEIAAQMEAGFEPLSSSQSRIKPVSMMAAVHDAMTEIHAAYEGQERRVVSSGVLAVDRFVPGFGPGEMWLLGGRPSMGKTAVALSMGLNAARAGHPVVIVSLEMTPQSMAMRALSEATSRQSAATNYTNLRSGEFSEKQGTALMEAAKEVANLPITFLPREYQDTDILQVGVRQTLRKIKSDKLPLIIVDYAQLLRSKAKSRYEQITEVSLVLKGMAMALECPVLALSQLSRNLESRDDKRPMLSDLRESGQLEQDADGVMFCYRDEYYLERDEPDQSDHETRAAWFDALEASRNKLEIIIAKQRQGPIGTAHVRFNPALNLIWEA